MKASEIARAVDGILKGEGDPDLDGVAPLDEAVERELSILAHPRYASYLGATRAGAVLVASGLAERVPATIPCIVVPDVHRALATVLPKLYPAQTPPPGVHPTAVIGRGVQLGADVAVGPGAVIGEDSTLGRGAVIGAHSVIGDRVEIAESVIIYPHVTVYGGSRIGARSIVHAGARIGVDGFGYATHGGKHHKIPQVGACVVGEDVEIGANTTIDRGSVGCTEIGDGVKIDNLVHIAHNVKIGAGSVIVAQVGVAGSTRVGKGVTLAGQVGIPGHLHIGDGATIAAQAGVFGDVPAGETYSGYPARPHRESLRAHAAVARLPKLIERLRALERAVFGDKGNDDE